MSFAMKTAIDFVIAVALLPDRATYSSWYAHFLTVLFEYCFLFPVKFLPSLSPTRLTFHQCCVDVLSVRSCLKLNRHNTLKLLSNFADSFRLVCCTVLSWKTIVFPHSRSEDAGGFTIAWSFPFVAMFENMRMSVSHMVCLIWKFSRGGRRATFLPSNTKWRTNDRTMRTENV